ncbi:MAG: MFS transporter [Treponemataceae bacterium]|nr:MFS transporter [Treponemataceae bacterium]
MSDTKKSVAATALSSGTGALILTVILVGLGEKIGERYLPVYLVATGASLFAPSILNALDNFLSAVYSFPGGWISTRFGYKRALLFFNIFAILGYLIVILFPGWVSIIIGSVFFLSWSSLSMPAYMDLIRHEIPKNRQVFGVSLHSLIKRVPQAIGPLLGGVLVDSFGIEKGIRLAFILAIACSVFGIFVQQSFLHKNPPKEKKAERFVAILPHHFPRQLQILLVSDILAKFCSQIPYAYIAIWAMEYEKGARISGTLFGTLTTIEMCCAIFSYVLVGLVGDLFKKKGFIMTTFILYVLFPLTLLISKNYPLLVVAFVIRGFKEFGEPVRKAQIMDLAPEGKESVYFGAFYLYRDILVTAGVFLGGALWLIQPELNLLAAAGFGLGACLIYGFFGKTEA